MKKIIFSILILIAVSARSQDTTKVYNLQLQARTILYLVPACINPANDSLYQTFLNWRIKFRATQPSGTTLVTTDSIPTVELANLYNYSLYNPEGLNQAASIKTQIATARSGNTFLDALCTSFENVWIDKLATQRILGRKLLQGK